MLNFTHLYLGQHPDCQGCDAVRFPGHRPPQAAAPLAHQDQEDGYQGGRAGGWRGRRDNEAEVGEDDEDAGRKDVGQHEV